MLCIRPLLCAFCWSPRAIGCANWIYVSICVVRFHFFNFWGNFVGGSWQQSVTFSVLFHLFIWFGCCCFVVIFCFIVFFKLFVPPIGWMRLPHCCSQWRLSVTPPISWIARSSDSSPRGYFLLFRWQWQWSVTTRILLFVRCGGLSSHDHFCCHVGSKRRARFNTNIVIE